MATTKLRPYRVDYFNHAEMEGSKAFLRSEMTRASTSAGAKAEFEAEGRTIVKASRYYKKLTVKPKLVAVTKLLSPRKAAALLKSFAEETYSINFNYVTTASTPQENPTIQEQADKLFHEQAQALIKEDMYGGEDEPARLGQLSDDYHCMFEETEEAPAEQAPLRPDCVGAPEESPSEDECCNAGPAPITYDVVEPSFSHAFWWIVATIAVLTIGILAYSSH